MLKLINYNTPNTLEESPLRSLGSKVICVITSYQRSWFSVKSACLFTRGWGQGPMWSLPMMHWTSLYRAPTGNPSPALHLDMGPDCTGATHGTSLYRCLISSYPADIWWPSLETCSNLFILGPPTGADIRWLFKHYSWCKQGVAHPTGMHFYINRISLGWWWLQRIQYFVNNSSKKLREEYAVRLVGCQTTLKKSTENDRVVQWTVKAPCQVQTCKTRWNGKSITCLCVRSYGPIASFRQQQEAWPIVEKRTFKVTTKSWVGHKKPILRKTPDPIGQVPRLLGRMLLQNVCIEMIHI